MTKNSWTIKKVSRLFGVDENDMKLIFERLLQETVDVDHSRKIVSLLNYYGVESIVDNDIVDYLLKKKNDIDKALSIDEVAGKYALDSKRLEDFVDRNSTTQREYTIYDFFYDRSKIPRKILGKLVTEYIKSCVTPFEPKVINKIQYYYLMGVENTDSRVGRLIGIQTKDRDVKFIVQYKEGDIKFESKVKPITSFVYKENNTHSVGIGNNRRCSIRFTVKESFSELSTQNEVTLFDIFLNKLLVVPHKYSYVNGFIAIDFNAFYMNFKDGIDKEKNILVDTTFLKNKIYESALKLTNDSLYLNTKLRKLTVMIKDEYYSAFNDGALKSEIIIDEFVNNTIQLLLMNSDENLSMENLILRLAEFVKSKRF